MFRYLFVILFILFAGIEDKKTNKISNYVILIGLIVGIIFNFFVYPITVMDHIIRVVFLILLTLFDMKTKWLGGGDMKVWIALDILVGPIYSAISIGVGSFILVIHSLKEDKNNIKLASIPINELLINGSLKNLTIFSEKSYPLIFYVIFPTIILCILSIIGVGFDAI